MPGTPNIPGILTFDVSSMTVLESPIPPVPTPREIVRKDQPFTLRSNFAVDGLIGRGMNDLLFGTENVLEYNVTYYAEKVGTGPDWDSPMLTIVCQTGTYSYGGPATDVIVPADTLELGNYKLTCIVKISPRTPGSSGFPFLVTGFVEGPMIAVNAL
jgi:hypothetical protein